ncbi:hypothetical protein [Flavobacterium ardleyense]|uniref:hypothetical protein n=1 Tax=Flavobacterium ardleyense TaxID=2038737 RepID=UPI00298CE746|nr:hypothetical protein [Flavobacterium ardleyense]
MQIQSEEIIAKLESILKKEKSSIDDGRFKPMSIEELNNRIDNSMDDSQNGRLIGADDLKAKMQKWS